MSPEKVPGWRKRYDDFIESSRTELFKWGDHDCVMFAAKALDAQYELGLVDYIRDQMPYDDLNSALDLIDEYGGLELLVIEVLGVQPLPPGLLGVGDIALYSSAYEGMPFGLAVHDGHQLLAPDSVGIAPLHLARSIKGWRPG